MSNRLMRNADSPPEFRTVIITPYLDRPSQSLGEVSIRDVGGGEWIRGSVTCIHLANWAVFGSCRLAVHNSEGRITHITSRCRPYQPLTHLLPMEDVSARQQAHLIANIGLTKTDRACQPMPVGRCHLVVVAGAG